MKSLLYFALIAFINLNPITGKVISVKDGDTIEILYEGKPLRIRLQGIDCPEGKQDFGQKAKQFASDLCFGKEVEIIDFGKDRYGRTLGYVVLPDGRNLNEELVRAGYAWHYKHFSKDKVLADLEKQARKEKVGLWSHPDPVAPWDYRRKGREAAVERMQWRV